LRQRKVETFLNEAKSSRKVNLWSSDIRAKMRIKDVPQGPKPRLVWAALPAWACRIAGLQPRRNDLDL